MTIRRHNSLPHTVKTGSETRGGKEPTRILLELVRIGIRMSTKHRESKIVNEQESNPSNKTIRFPKGTFRFAVLSDVCRIEAVRAGAQDRANGRH